MSKPRQWAVMTPHGRQTLEFVSAVLQWQQGYACERSVAVKAVSQLLGRPCPDVTNRQWAQPRTRSRGRPVGDTLSRAQNFAVIALFYQASGARTMHAFTLAHQAMAPGEGISQHRGLKAIKWAQAVLGGNNFDTLATHATLAWATMGRRGTDPAKRKVSAGRSPGRPRERRFKVTNY